MTGAPNPREDLRTGPLCSLAFDAQANHGVMIESRAGKYEPITAEDYLYRRVNASFAAGKN